jgi:hypothetical protein
MPKPTPKFVIFEGDRFDPLEETVEVFLASLDPIGTPTVSVSNIHDDSMIIWRRVIGICWVDTEPMETTRAKKAEALKRLTETQQVRSTAGAKSLLREG